MPNQKIKTSLLNPGQLFASSSLSGIVARGAIAAFLIQSISSALKYFNLILFARWMGAEEFGRYSYGLAWVQILAILAGLGLNSGALKFFPQYVVRKSWGSLRGFIQLSRRGTLLSGLGLALGGSLLIRSLFPGQPLATALLIALWLVPLSALASLHLELTRAMQRIPQAYAPLLIGQPILLIALTYASLRLRGAITSQTGFLAGIMVFGLIILIQAYLFHKLRPLEITRASPQYATREWLRVSFPLLFISLSLIVLNQTGTLFLGYWEGPISAGVYAAGQRTVTLVGFILLAVNTIAAPLIASLHARQDFSALQQMLKGITIVTLVVSSGVALILIVFGRSILQIFGPEFSQMYSALVFLSLAEVINASAGPVGYLINLTGFELFSARVYGVSAIINLSLNAILIPIFGLIGAAAASFLTTLLWNVWLSVLVKNKLGLRTFFFLLRRQIPDPSLTG